MGWIILGIVLGIVVASIIWQWLRHENTPSEDEVAIEHLLDRVERILDKMEQDAESPTIERRGDALLEVVEQRLNTAFMTYSVQLDHELQREEAQLDFSRPWSEADSLAILARLEQKLGIN